MIPIEDANVFYEGKEYPPENERARISLFEKFWRWSNRSYVGLDPNVSRPTQLQFAIPAQAQRLQPNMFRFVMDFWADAVGEPPVIEYTDDNQRVSDFISRLASPLAKATTLVVADLIRYGVAVFYSRHALIPEVLDPRFWFPVAPGYEADNVSYGDVVAYPYNSGVGNAMDNNRLFIAAHLATEPWAKIVELKGLTIGNTLQVLKDFKFVPNAVVPLTLGSGGRYGVSDFADIAEYVAELHRRESSISESLDRHANPHLAVSQGSVQPTETGDIELSKEGSVLFIPDGERVVPQYVQWSPDFTAHQDAILRAEQRILRLSQIAPILATPGAIANGLSIPSGSALRRLALISVNRLRVIRQALTEAYKRVIPAQAQLYAEMGGERIAIDGDKINVTWPPPFGTGYQDEADAIAALVGSGAMSRELALQLVEQSSRREAERKINEGDSDASAQQDVSA